MKGKFYDIAEKYLTEEIMNSVPELDDHVFSRRYLKQKKKIISRFGQDQVVHAHCRPRLKYIIAAVIFAAMPILLATSDYRAFGGYGYYYGPFKMAPLTYIGEDIYNKEVITEFAYFDADMSEYEIEEYNIRDIFYCVSYIKDDTVIYLDQYTNDALKTVSPAWTDTTEVINNPEEINIGEYKGMFYISIHNSNKFYVQMNGYTISVWASNNYSREMLEDLILSIKFK